MLYARSCHYTTTFSRLRHSIYVPTLSLFPEVARLGRTSFAEREDVPEHHAHHAGSWDCLFPYQPNQC